MPLKLFTPARNLLKATNFWKDNYLILREFKHFRKVAILALIFSFLAASFEGVSIGLLLSFLQNLTEPNAKPIQIGINWFDIWILGVNTSATSRLYRISGLIFLSVWIRSLFNYLSNVYIEVSQLNLLAHLRQQIFEQLQALSLSYFAKTKSGEIVNTITSETERIKSVFNGSAFLITRALTVLIYVLSIVWISWQLSIISVMLFSLLVVGLSTLNKKVREASFEISKASGYFTSTAMEFINGIRTVQAFATQDFERKRFYQATWNLVSTSDKVVKLSAMVKPLAEGLATTLLVSMIIIAFTLFVAKGTLPVGSLLTFFFVLFRLVPILQDINGVRAHLASLQGAVENIKELLRTDNKKYFKNGKTEFLGLNRSIDLVSVDFAYDTSNLILNNIMLTIKR